MSLMIKIESFIFGEFLKIIINPNNLHLLII